jgi:hypothetical protein
VVKIGEDFDISRGQGFQERRGVTETIEQVVLGMGRDAAPFMQQLKAPRGDGEVLVIEVDGSQHGEEPNRQRDDKRTLWLESAGYRVLRFWNNDIVQNPQGVLDVIYAALYGSRDFEPTKFKHERSRAHPTPARSARRPSPSRGG